MKKVKINLNNKAFNVKASLSFRNVLKKNFQLTIDFSFPFLWDVSLYSAASHPPTLIIDFAI